MAPRKPELFRDVLEDDLGGRSASPKQRVGGASLRPDEFGPGRPQQDIVDRFNILRAEEEALRSQAQRESRKTKRMRWTGTIWILSLAAGLGVAALGYMELVRYQQQAAQRELTGAAAARRSAEEERMLRMQKVSNPPASAEPASAPPKQ